MLDTWVNRKGSASEAWLTAVARHLLEAGWSSDMLTYAGLATGVLGGLFFYLGHPVLAFAALLLSALLDAVDGRVARLGRGATPWGGVLDLTFDRVVEAAILLGIALPRPELHAAALVVAATWYINISVFLAIGAATEKHSEKVIFYPPGLLERGESLLFAFLVVVVPSWGEEACYIYAMLEMITAAQRFRYGREALRDSG